MKFALRFWSNSSDIMARLDTFEMELYIILATLEKFECWNPTLLITRSHQVK